MLFLFCGLLLHPIPCILVNWTVGEATRRPRRAVIPEMEKLAGNSAKIVAVETRVSLETGSQNKESASLIAGFDLLNCFPWNGCMRKGAF